MPRSRKATQTKRVPAARRRAGAVSVAPHASVPPSPGLALAFYNGREHGTWLDRLIARHDRAENAGPFSHVEIVFQHLPQHASLCFSSSYRDGGVRFKRIRLEETAGKWTLVGLGGGPREARRVRAWCMNHLGGRYDLPGVLAFKLPLVRQRLNWWFCSEICVAALQQVGLLADQSPHRLSPNGLYRLAKELVKRDG